MHFIEKFMDKIVIFVLTYTVKYIIIGNKRRENIVQIINGENQTCSDRTTDEYITVNSCGFYEVTGRDIKTDRPDGRTDYQLIYIAGGRAMYFSDGAYRTAHGGDLLLYRPFEPQRYCFCAGCGTKAYWIHFTGTGADEVLKEAGFSGVKHCTVGSCDEIGEYVFELTREIQLARPGFELFCRAIFLSVIASAARALCVPAYRRNTHKYDKLIPAIEKMNSCMNDTSSIRGYAQECCMDPYYFIALFREYTGLSPHAYRTMIKLEKAKQLLIDTTMTNGEIAELLGYRDSLYFSRVFKKHVGMSPNIYKKNIIGTQK